MCIALKLLRLSAGIITRHATCFLKQLFVKYRLRLPFTRNTSIKLYALIVNFTPENFFDLSHISFIKHTFEVQSGSNNQMKSSLYLVAVHGYKKYLYVKTNGIVSTLLTFPSS